MSIYAATVWGVYLAVSGLALARSRVFGLFASIILLFPAGVGLALREHLGPFSVAVPYFQVASALYLVGLIWRPTMHRWPVRVLITWPASWFIAATFFALPWGLFAVVGLAPYGAFIPFALATIGLIQSLWTKEETVDLDLQRHLDTGPLARFTQGVVSPADAARRRPLTIVQITDPHLGPFMSVRRLRRICQRAVERKPDLILLTGDLMTMESQRVEIVSRALEPLEAYAGRVFACHGNHDHEAREVVRQAYARHRIELLVDDATTVETPAGSIQIVGFDFIWRHRQVHMKRVCERYPRVPGVMRLLLVHDPGAFTHLPPGEGDLVLSGHTHGGQLGLLSLGGTRTFVSQFTSIPDHGLWARGHDRLYVHRAQGHYGFPLRLGVPGEQSLVRVWS